MSNSNITLDDLLAGQSSVLARIARDLEDMGDTHPTAGHNSQTGGHNSSGSHTSHTSGVSAAAPLPTSAHLGEQDPVSESDET